MTNPAAAFMSTTPLPATAKPGKLRAAGRVVRAGETIAFLEGELFAADGTLLARSTSSARVLTGQPGG